MAIQANLEQEFKFDVDPAFDPPDLRPLVGVTVRLPEQQLVTTYYDTPDLRLWGRGITLRHRQEEQGRERPEGKWTLKLPAGAGAGADADTGPASATFRSEYTWPGTAGDVPAEAASILAGVVRRAQLEPLVELRSQRRRLLLQGGQDDRPWAEVDDDLVTVAGGPRHGLRFRQLEVELVAPDPAEVGHRAKAVTTELTRAGARPSRRSKLAVAAGLDDRAPAPSPAVSAGPLVAVVRRIITSDLDRLLDADYRLRLPGGEPDGEAVRRARTACRRLRTDLKAFKKVLDPVWAAHVKETLREVGELLGRLRDEDVLRARIEAHSEEADRDCVQELLALLRSERHLGVGDLAEMLSSAAYYDLLDRLHAAAERPPLISSGADPSRVLHQAVRRRWKAFKRRLERAGLDGGADPTALHRLRIRAKELRYTAAAAAPELGRPARRVAERSHRLQSVLGDLHDAGAAAHTLSELASHPSVTPAVAFVAGKIAARAESERAGLMRRWARPAGRLDTPKLRRWVSGG